jgi:hypothetical protein
MENKTPEQIAAELYPIIQENREYDCADIAYIQRQTWLSRQTEIDELKKQIIELKEHCDERVRRGKDAGFVECSRILRKQLAAAEKEIEEFAEWIDKKKLVRLLETGDHKWYSNMSGNAGILEKPRTTTELLKQFRDESK